MTFWIPYSKYGYVRNFEVVFLKEIAIFAGGCFWNLEYEFSKLNLENLEVGYELPNGKTFKVWKKEYFEVVRMEYDEVIVKYEELLDLFWKSIDPQDRNGQFIDRGLQYRSAIFYTNDLQKRLALLSKERVKNSGLFEHVHTLILKAGTFMKAEEHHQRYYLKFPIDFRIHRDLSNRKIVRKKWEKFGNIFKWQE